MSVTVVVGGQYGSEGKGKVAQFFAAERHAAAAVRVGGSNSGHTGFGRDDKQHVFRHLPTAALLPEVQCLIGAGSYVDPDVLLEEIARTRLTEDRLLIDEKAMIITAEDRASEAALRERIGSTASGTGAAVMRRIARQPDSHTVADVPSLARYCGDTAIRLREILDKGKHVVVEGTQGFGLSVLHSPHYPHATSRDTTASSALSEAGLSPRDVEDVVLVLRSYPIRVAGSSGPLLNELSWEALTAESGSPTPLEEFTSVTGKIRRVARFDAEIVRRAIRVNQPSIIVLNHVDYIDAQCADSRLLTSTARAAVDEISFEIGQPIDLVGVGPSALAWLRSQGARLAS
jgi:adenylosuccinate synthase